VGDVAGTRYEAVRMCAASSWRGLFADEQCKRAMARFCLLPQRLAGERTDLQYAAVHTRYSTRGRSGCRRCGGIAQVCEVHQGRARSDAPLAPGLNGHREHTVRSGANEKGREGIHGIGSREQRNGGTRLTTRTQSLSRSAYCTA